MKKHIASVVLVLGALVAADQFAETPASVPEFSIQRHTVDGGGGLSSGGIYAIRGTIGQPDANAETATQGVTRIAGGFWARAIDFLFKDSFEDI